MSKRFSLVFLIFDIAIFISPVIGLLYRMKQFDAAMMQDRYVRSLHGVLADNVSVTSEHVQIFDNMTLSVLSYVWVFSSFLSIFALIRRRKNMQFNHLVFVVINLILACSTMNLSSH